MVEILIPLGFFASVFGIVYLSLTTRNKERMALIEKGADASLFSTGKSFRGGRIVLNVALLAIGIGIGVLAGALLEKSGIEGEVAFPACIFIFAGLGLVTGFILNRKMNQEDI